MRGREGTGGERSGLGQCGAGSLVQVAHASIFGIDAHTPSAAERACDEVGICARATGSVHSSVLSGVMATLQQDGVDLLRGTPRVLHDVHA